ncbi:LapA family protein [Mycobacterium colombiense]|uniref:LapA family protein n=1 Tax=Mycobacterium colombiense TaxID=339268 RepID=A0A329LMA1_9MYCO|nr:LapA family protein [Mycobacterium colombiense]
MKNPAKIPGVFLVGIGVVAVAFCVISFARQHLGLAILAVVIAVGATGAGLGWLAREAKRLRELERQHDNP